MDALAMEGRKWSARSKVRRGSECRCALRRGEVECLCVCVLRVRAREWKRRVVDVAAAFSKTGLRCGSTPGMPQCSLHSNHPHHRRTMRLALLLTLAALAGLSCAVASPPPSGKV